MSLDTPPIRDGSLGGPENPGRWAKLAARVGPSVNALRGRSWIGWSLLAGGALFATLLALHWVVSSLLHARQVVQVPDLKGKTLEQALDLLSPVNLSLSKESIQFDENFPPGTVVRQAPPAGLRVREWKVVRVTLSSGGQIVYVPDMAGTTLTEAQNRLRTAGLTLGAVTQVHSNQFETGAVMTQVPDPGTLSHPGAMVDLKVSKGPPPAGTVLMPDFVNKPLSLAQQWASDQSLTPDIKEELSATALPGLILRQLPPPDAPVGKDTPLNFTVATSSTTAARDITLVRYDVPAGTDRAQVRVVLRDDSGEREVFSGTQNPGSTVEVAVSPDGPARARIFVNGVLVEERTIAR